MTLWRFQLALHLVYMVYTKLLHTNRGLGGVLETPNTPLKNVQIQGIAINQDLWMRSESESFDGDGRKRWVFFFFFVWSVGFNPTQSGQRSFWLHGRSWFNSETCPMHQHFSKFRFLCLCFYCFFASCLHRECCVLVKW